jgi:hypothetical protein
MDLIKLNGRGIDAGLVVSFGGFLDYITTQLSLITGRIELNPFYNMYMHFIVIAIFPIIGSIIPYRYTQYYSLICAITFMFVMMVVFNNIMCLIFTLHG